MTGRKKALIGLSSLVLLVGLSAVVGAVTRSFRPRVICVMENPETHKRVEMYREIWFKVPANYDEKKHIASWKSEQRDRGFTVEVSL